jgi:predicted ATPase
MKKITPNWYVITGGPSSGKTTVIQELAKLGYLVAPDVARDYINQKMAKGRSLKEIRANEAKFQKKVLKMKIEREEKIPMIPMNKIVFLDNAIPCSIAYYQICGIDPQGAINLSKNKKYRKIFFLEQLPIKKDNARTENTKTIKKLNKLLKKGYESLGYKVIDIPVMPVKKRVQKILKEVKKN